MEGLDGRKSGPLQKGVERVERFLEEWQIWIALVAGVGLFLMQVPGIQDGLSKIGIESSQRVRTGVSVILLTSILLELWYVKRRLTPSPSGRVHFSDPDEMYTALSEKAKAIQDAQQRKIDVVGMTLYSAWPVLSFLLARPDMHNWTVRLATIAPDAVAPLAWVPDDWTSESKANIKQIQTFAERQGAEHGHRLEVIEYDFVPGVHGFRLGNGDVFVSVLLWQEDGRLGKPGFTYEYVPWDDPSSAAASARNLFDNWFERAVRCAESRREAAPEQPGGAEVVGKDKFDG